MSYDLSMYTQHWSLICLYFTFDLYFFILIIIIMIVNYNKFVSRVWKYTYVVVEGNCTFSIFNDIYVWDDTKFHGGRVSFEWKAFIR